MSEPGSNADRYEYNPEAERPELDEIRDSISKHHKAFLEKVPRYSKAAWNPIDAIKMGEGSCMAELLYVVGGLLHSGVGQEADFNIGFRRDHGTKLE